jgi:hypothetical protein
MAVVLSRHVSALAAPEIDIKAQTILQLRSVRQISDKEVSVSGVLVDKLTNAGIANTAISVTFAGASAPVVTGSDGSFSATLLAPLGQQPLSLRFDGGPLMDASHIDTTADPSRQAVQLTATASPSARGADIRVETLVDGEPSAVPLAISIGVEKDGKESPVAQSTSNVVYTLTRSAIGGAGIVKVHVRFAGDPSRQPAEADIAVELRVASHIGLHIEAAEDLAYESAVVATGVVTDDDDQPIASAVVSLYVNDRRLDQVATNKDGKFRISIEAKLLGQGQFGITARVERAALWDASISPPAVVRIAAPQPVPVRYTVMAFAATMIAALFFFIGRRQRRPEHQRRTVVPPVAAQAHGGVELGKKASASAMRRANQLHIAGVVRDSIRKRSIASAHLSMSLQPAIGAADESKVFSANVDGVFHSEDLHHGRWRVTVSQPGYVAESFVAKIPHHGEYSSIKVDLVSIRERVFHVYRKVAEPLLPSGAIWGVWSPRQIVDHVRSKRPSPALATLTDLVEEVYFSPRIASDAVLPQTQAQADAAMAERAHLARRIEPAFMN